jgi:hypothetical protein
MGSAVPHEQLEAVCVNRAARRHVLTSMTVLFTEIDPCWPEDASHVGGRACISEHWRAVLVSERRADSVEAREFFLRATHWSLLDTPSPQISHSDRINPWCLAARFGSATSRKRWHVINLMNSSAADMMWGGDGDRDILVKMWLEMENANCARGACTCLFSSAPGSSPETH